MIVQREEQIEVVLLGLTQQENIILLLVPEAIELTNQVVQDLINPTILLEVIRGQEVFLQVEALAGLGVLLQVEVLVNQEVLRQVEAPLPKVLLVEVLPEKTYKI